MVNIEYGFGIIISLAIYGIMIALVKDGRCSRHEYIIKKLIIIGLYIFTILMFFLGIPVISFIMFIFLYIVMYHNVKYTLQRLFDLRMSSYYLLLTIIPIAGLIITIILCIRKSSIKMNEYDDAVNYKKLFKGKHFLNIFKNKIEYDDVEFGMDYYLGKYLIKISKNVEKNVFSDYLLRKFTPKIENIYSIVEIGKDDLQNIIKENNLIVIYESQFIVIKNYKIFIRYYDFKYDIIMDKNDHELTKDIIDTFNFPGAYLEDDEYIYYTKISKEEILDWIKNVA